VASFLGIAWLLATIKSLHAMTTLLNIVLIVLSAVQVWVAWLLLQLTTRPTP